MASDLTKFIRGWLKANGDSEERYWIYNDKIPQGRSIKIIWSGWGDLSFHFNRKLFRALKQNGFKVTLEKTIWGKWRFHVVDTIA